MTTTVQTPSLENWRSSFDAIERTCPWPGPRPLHEHDAGLLSGRSEDCVKFRLAVDGHRLVLLTGHSGVGKTSLLRAGLVPSLRSSGYQIAVCRDWSGSADAKDSLAFVARLVNRELGRQGIDGLADDPTIFWQLNQRFGERIVLILDQFEELIRDARDFKEDLFDVLAEINHRTSIKVVVSFRAEHLHDLRDLERRAKPFSITHYFLEEVDREKASEVVLAANVGSELAIEPAAADLVVDAWKAAIKDRYSGTGDIGLLHLQALLYVLHDAVMPGPVTKQSVEAFQISCGLSGRDHPADLLAGALREAIQIKLRRCRQASVSIGLDQFLIEGTVQFLARSVEHLSSAGFKLIRDARDLALATIGEEIESLSDGIRECRGTDGTHPDGPVTAAQIDALFNVLIAPVLASSEHSRPRPAEPVEPVDAASIADFVGDVDSLLPAHPIIDLLSADRGSIAIEADRSFSTGTGPGWAHRLHPGASSADVDAATVTCGPMLGVSPAAVLIEELRRFVFMLEWLRASSIVRLSTPRAGEAMVALVHDGFAAALERWSAEAIRRPDGPIHAITAPRGAQFSWTTLPAGDDGPERTGQHGEAYRQPFLAPFDGRGRPSGRTGDSAAVEGTALVNMRWRGAWVHAAFRQLAFVNCDLRGTFFHQCLFAGVTFVNCLLDGTIFSECTVLGRPSPPVRGISRTPPEFRISIPEDVLWGMARLRGIGDQVTSLYSRGAGLPATPINDQCRGRHLEFESGGLVVYGGRLSTLVIRSCTFEEDGKFSLREVAGSGLDVVEVRDSGEYEIAGSVLRHGTFTSPVGEPMSPSDRLSISILDSAVAQLWIGDDVRGTLEAEDSTLLQVWNGAAEMTARARACTFHGLVNVEVDASTPLISGEAGIEISALDPEGDLAELARVMDYRLDPSAGQSG